jgi:hypothetical protein
MAESNYQRNTTDDAVKDDFDYFITTELPLHQIQNMLSLQKKSESEIEKILERVKDTREKIRKSVRKFIRKVNNYYGHLDIPELIKKGLKHASKHKHTEAEKKVFIQHVMKGDIHNEFTMLNELKYTPMAKFLGYSENRGQMLKIEAQDHSKLNELKMMYDQTLILHSNVKNDMFNYRDCAAEAITGHYDRTKHDVHVSIHPVIAMLFFPKVDYIEKRMLFTNIARMVLSRGQAYLKNVNFHLQSGVAPGELDAEFELAHDIAYDPNSLEHFTDHTPITNVIKRFRCQIELYKAVLNLRQGRYYSTGYGADDGISGFLRVINEQDWTFFDSPDLYHVQDEGTVLRKLLAVFSVRPSFTQLTSFGQRYGLGHSNITNLAKTKLLNTPIINIKLPLDFSGNQVNQKISLARSLTQTDTFIEHRSIVPKNKSVIYSNQVCFFYANRKYQSMNFASLDATLSMRYTALPTPVMNTTSTNTTQIGVEKSLRIGRDFFDLRSVCILQRPPLNGFDIPTGAASLVRSIGSNGQESYLHYNPSNAAIQFLDPALPQNATQYRANDPVTHISEYDDPMDPTTMGFMSEAKRRGTIFFYTKQ